MFRITPNQQWKNFHAIYGSKDIFLRYQWFLFEFGKRASKLFYKNLLQRITTLEGSDHYKKSLMLAEIRETGRKSWWAIVCSAKPLGDAKYDPKTSIFQVVSRFTRLDEDPVAEILEALGPWTVETIPFLPSARAGQVVMKTVTESKAKEVQEANFKRAELTRMKMIKHEIPFTPRHVVYETLRVVRDLEAEALRIEFGLATRSRPHWRPSLRWIRKEGLKKMEREQHLIRVWTDPRFVRYRLMRHYRIKLTPNEVKRMEQFQNKIR